MSGIDDCERIAELLPEHLAGRLTPSEEIAVRAHLEGCADCRRRASAVSLLQQTPVPTPDPDRWDHFVEGVVEAADRRRRWPWAAAALAAAAVAVTLLVRAPSPEGVVGGLEAVAREVAELPEAEASTWTVGVDPVELVPAGSDVEAISDDELRELVREAGRT